MIPTYRVLVGDVREKLGELPEGSIQLCVTSPPYWSLRSYLGEDLKHLELGAESLHDCLAWAKGNPPCGQCYVCNLREVFAGVWRAMRDDGVLLLNLGDGYTSGGRSRRAPDTKSEGRGMEYRPDTPAALKPKDLVGIPYRVALALQADGWWWRDPIVWAKGASFGGAVSGAGGALVAARDALVDAGVEVPEIVEEMLGQREFVGNSMPGSQKDRPTVSHEYLWMMTKSARYYWDWYAVVEDAACGRVRGTESWEHVPNGGDNSGLSHRECSGTRSLRSVWLINTKPCDWEYCKSCATLFVGRERSAIRKEKVKQENGHMKTIKHCPCGATDGWVDHYAAFPPELVEPCVRAGSAELVCKECGWPWVRVVKKGKPVLKAWSAEGAAQYDDAELGMKARPRETGSTLKHAVPVESGGFEQRCDCVAPAVPMQSAVLDPFAGSGTAGIVALREGRSFIGIDLNEDYAAVAEARCGRALHELTPEADL